MRKLQFLSLIVLTLASWGAKAQTDLSAYADANGYLDVQKLTCAQLANTWQEDANLLTAWYSGWYNGLAKKHYANLRRGKLVPNDRLLDQIEPHLSDREVDDVLRADVIASGLVDGEQAHLVVEVSWTGDIDDIVRADERAKLLRRAGLPAIPLVACNAISPESTAFAKLREVRIWLDGSLVGASAN